MPTGAWVASLTAPLPLCSLAISYVGDEHRRVAGHTNTDADAAAVDRDAAVTEMAPTGPFRETVPQLQDCLPRNLCPGWKLPQPAHEVPRR